MSSGGFKENFERGDKESLDYDDSAFYYFGLALLVVSVIPLTWIMIIKPIFYGDIAVNYSLKNCRCYVCEERMQKRAAIYKFNWLNGWFVFKLIIVILLWITTFKCYVAIKDVEPLKTFVPNEILGVEIDATVAQVKKAYRKLSREKHPDKNPDNPDAVEEFISITKAYTIMTDEKARENFLKYGNPDGKGSMAVGIALPRFLQNVDY
jgi:translocation protein SEC63